MLRPFGVDLWLWPFFVAGPLVLCGGIYWFPACHISRERDPLLTVLLAVGLAVTVLVIGLLSAVSWPEILVATLASWCLLLVRRAFGSLGHALERFYPVHAITLIGMLVLSGQSSS